VFAPIDTRRQQSWIVSLRAGYAAAGSWSEALNRDRLVLESPRCKSDKNKHHDTVIACCAQA